VEFTPGTTHLLEKHERRLHALAKGLHERPALELELLPGFDPKQDAHALAMARLDARLLELRKRAMAQLTNTLPLVVVPTAASPDASLSPAERSQLLRLAYVHEFGAPAGVGQPVGNPETTTPAAAVAEAVSADPHRGDAAAAAALALSDAELELRLSGLNPVKPEELRALAAARGEVVRAYLTGAGGLAAERLLPASTNAPAEVLEKARVTFRLE
ncbi:MAG: hypothetical protein IT580_12185, partial [Verrucomicrobiales bacterium]|nr:hypothetical protein [Verrucomicrobiales bacterium]